MLEIKMEGCRRTFPGLSFNVFVGGCGGGVCVYGVGTFRCLLYPHLQCMQSFCTPDLVYALT